MASITTQRLVDHSAIKVNQSFIVGLLVLAFVSDAPALAAFVGAVMLLGTVWPRLALFQALYRGILAPWGLVKPHVIEDNPEPHRFAQGMGAVVVGLAATALFLGQGLLGWALAWVVIGLAALNLFLGFCAGCFIYYQLNRLGVPGFLHGPLHQG